MNDMSSFRFLSAQQALRNALGHPLALRIPSMPGDDVRRRGARSRVIDLRAEHHREAMGIGERTPRLSWKVLPDRHPWLQTAYQLEISDLETGETERTPVVPSPESVLVPWPGQPLESARPPASEGARVVGHLGHRLELAAPRGGRAAGR